MSCARHIAVAGAVLFAVGPYLLAQESPPESSGKRPESPPAKVIQKGGPAGKSKSKPARPAEPAERPEDSSGATAPETQAAEPAESTKPQARSNGTQRREPIDPTAREIQFAFATAPWDKVLQWFAEISGLSLQMDVKPTGTFNYINDPQKYTLGEAMDVLNDQLVPKGFTLIRKGNYLKIVALAEGIPQELIPRITPEELDQRGSSEFVSVVFPLKSVLAKAAAEEIKGLSGPYEKTCKVVPLESVNRLMITDTADNVRLMRDLLEQIDGTGAVLQSKTRIFQLKFTVASKVEVVLRDLLGLPPRTAAATSQQSQRSSRDPGEEWRDRMRAMFQGGGPPWMQFGGEQRGEERRDRGSDRDRGGQQQQQSQQPNVYVAVDERLNQILVKAPADTLALIEEVIAKIDVPRDGEDPFTPGEPQSPIVKMYRIDGDAQSLATALSTIYQNTPGVRFSATADNAIIAVATPDDQKAIAELIQQFEEENLELGVLPLSVLDATAVSDLLGAVYSSGQTDWRGRPVARPGQPRIQADRTQNRIVVRGSRKQIDDIKGMLSALGETQLSGIANNERLRFVPLARQDAKSVAEALQQIWPSMGRSNPVRIIEPGKRSADGPDSHQPVQPEVSPPANDADEPGKRSGRPRVEPGSSREPARAKPPAGQTDRTPRDSRGVVQLVSYAQQRQDGPQQRPRRDRNRADAAAEQKTSDQPPPEQESPPVVIAIGPDGIVVASEDPEALQAMMNVLNTLTRGSTGAGEFTVFYLKAADATQIAQTLNDLLGLSITSSLFSGTSAPVSTLKIVPDTRTNSLIVSGSSADVTRVSQLLEVLDRDDAPSSGALSQARIIPVRYSSATSVASVIRDVYASQLVQGGRGPTGLPGFTVGGFGGGFPGGTSQFGGGTSSGSTARGSRGGTLSIGVDDRSNSLVVSCTEAMFKEISQLVETLDNAANDTKRSVKIVTIRNSTPTAVQDALNGLMGVNTRSRDSSRSSRDGFQSGGGFFGGFPGGGFPGGFQGQPGAIMFQRDGRDSDRGDRRDRGRDGGPSFFPFGEGRP